MGSSDAEYRCFVGGLALATFDDDLTQAFSSYGEVLDSKVIYDRDTGLSSGFGFVTFAEEKHMNDAIEGMNGEEIGGSVITVKEAKSRGSGDGGESSNTEYRCFVGGLALDTFNHDLSQAFSSYGEVLDSKVIYDRDTGLSRGFGFVTFADEKEMNDAIEGMNGEEIGDSVITVKEAKFCGSGDGGESSDVEYPCFVGGLAWATVASTQAFGEEIGGRVITVKEAQSCGSGSGGYGGGGGCLCGFRV